MAAQFSCFAFVGSRSLPGRAARLVSAVSGAVLRAGFPVSVGCASGADAAVLLTACRLGLASQVSVFAVGGPSGAGFSSSVSAFSLVSRAAAAGAAVRWFASGALSVPLRVRLAVRARACVRSVAPGGAVVAFFGSPSSRGSLQACAFAVKRGLPVFAFSCGQFGAPAPLHSGGQWVRVQFPVSSVAASCWRWVAGSPQQLRLF